MYGSQGLTACDFVACAAGRTYACSAFYGRFGLNSCLTDKLQAHGDCDARIVAFWHHLQIASIQCLMQDLMHHRFPMCWDVYTVYMARLSH